MFTVNSGLVIIWASLVRTGRYTEDKVPALSNLRDMVHQVLGEREGT